MAALTGVGAVAEALAVVGHQVHGREVRFARDATRRELADDRVALEAAGQLHDEHEPAAAGAARVRARQPQALDRSQRLLVERGQARPFGQHPIEPL